MRDVKAWSVAPTGLVVKVKYDAIYVIADGSRRKFAWLAIGLASSAVLCDEDKIYVAEDVESLVRHWLLDKYDESHRKAKAYRKEYRHSGKFHDELKREEERLAIIKKLLDALDTGKAKIEVWTPRMIQSAFQKRAVYLR